MREVGIVVALVVGVVVISALARLVRLPSPVLLVAGGIVVSFLRGVPEIHLECGHVACCDSSRGKHAAAHFHTTLHPVMRSAEAGEAWRWCYIDRLTG